MKRIFFVAAVLAGLLFSMGANAGPRDAQWKAVEEAIQKGLPRTAITNLEPIIAGALKDKNYAEAVKAIGEKIALEGNVQGNKPEEKITRLQAEIAKAPAEMVPLMDTLLAEWYWQYFQRNRWRFMQRTATAQAPGKDFTTWDLPRLFAEIDRQFQKALKAEAILKATPISAWNDLLLKGTMPDSYRPTLYDFIVYEALSFYTTGEQAGARPENTFQLSAETPILDAAEKFLAWKPGAAPGASGEDKFTPELRAIALYQDLLRFHQKDAAPRAAFAAADLERLTWGWNASFGENKSQRYAAALENFIKASSGTEVSTLAIERAARLKQSEGDLVAARNLAISGAETFPQSPGAKLCHNLIQEIEAKSASIATERVWNCFAGGSGADANTCPDITVQYRNVTNVYFRAVPWKWEVFLEKHHNRPENLNEEERKAVLAATNFFAWSAALPATTNYRTKSISLPAPTTLKPGFYFIIASHDPSFGETENIVSLTTVWVSDLALITRTRDARIEGFVLDANTGEPLPGSEVSVWHLNNSGDRVGDPSLTTDELGFFSMKAERNRGYLLRASHAGRKVATSGDIADYYFEPEEKPAGMTFFFTDRAIYRPGQTIQYKGISLWVDKKKNDYEVLTNEAVTVVFRDPNGKEIARKNHRANAFGSFTGSFTAPRDRLMGGMTLVAEGRAKGQAWLRVEEYKRPKFEVTLDAPKTAARLNEKAALTGHAMGYTGAAVDGARVEYRVTRMAQMPWWWWGRWGGGSGDSQEIAHGTTKTETDGTFKIDFTATADPKVLPKDEPVFTFQVHADVTDNAGETRSADFSVRLGYAALEATLSAGEWQTEQRSVEISATTKTLDGEPQVAEGSVKIYDLQVPARAHRPALSTQPYYGYHRGIPPPDGAEEDRPAPDMSDPNNWPLGKVIAEKGFTTDTNGMAKLSFKLPEGAYRAVLETQDRFGKKVTARQPLLVRNPESPQLKIKIPWIVAAPSWEAQPGQDFVALWGTGYESGRAFVEIEHHRKIIKRFWTAPGRTQEQVKVAVTEAMRGGFQLHITQVRDNRALLDSRQVSVPWKNKDLDLSWEHFVSKLQPGAKETWTLVIRPSGTDVTNSASVQKSAAELVATLYDESLDAFAPLNWPEHFNVFYNDFSYYVPQFVNFNVGFEHLFGGWSQNYEEVQISYRSFPPDLTAALWGYGYFTFGGRSGGPMVARRMAVATDSYADANGITATAAMPAPASPTTEAIVNGYAKEVPASAANMPAGGAYKQTDKIEAGGGSANAPKPDLSKVTARKNLNETAFFFPQLTSDSNGVVRMTFTMPEALTKWHFRGFAHDQSVRSGFLQGHAVTSKDIMVQPNPPRFLREGDAIEFTVKVSNQSDVPQSGAVKLSFKDALTDQPADKLLGLRNTEQSFNIPAKESRAFSWRISVPDGCPYLTYQTVAASAKFSDGEAGAIPVLSRRILVTESLPLPIRGPATKKFNFTSLEKSGSSKSLQNESLVVQMVSQPAWYAVLALPYLMEYPYECSEQIFNRFYANSLARSIANSDPKIQRIFEQWRNTPALESPLEKNQDLKSVMLEETPWLRQAQSESQARKNVGILFDNNRLNYETEATLQKLAERQLPDGTWSWFPGGHGDRYITLYITTGFGRLRRLGVDVNVQPAVRALRSLDEWMDKEYKDIQKGDHPEKYVPSSTVALYLYGRSFFLKDRPIAKNHQPAIDFFLKQSRKFWLATNCRQTQGHLALGLLRFNAANPNADATPQDIMKSLKERSVTDDEMGRFWRETELSWWWYRAPIETQALMIEAFDEITHDAKAVEECQVWLLKQKQTQDWKTTKATADAVYALLLRGKNLLSSDALVEVKLGGLDITPGSSSRAKLDASHPQPSTLNPQPKPEAGTGFYEYRFAPADIKPKLGEITVKKTDPGAAWGSVTWQYLEDMSKVVPYAGTPLKLKKSLFVKQNTSSGPVLQPVKGALNVGDELVVRVELRTDRDMEYVHLEDQRGSGTEPVNVLSRYKYQDGLGYYESTRDVASHFFIDYLPKGVYVFEYSTRIQLRGQYQTGIAQIQCMYAPEFNSHSESIPLVVK